MKVTLDTNILPADDLLGACKNRGFDFAAVSTTEREFEGTDLLPNLEPLTEVMEPAVYGESRLGKAKYGSHETRGIREEILAIICLGAFPRNRSGLSKGHRRQFRDAMIFQAHVREGRDIFVTDNSRDFIRDGRREELQKRFSTRIMTRDEFLAFAKSRPIHT